MDERELDVIDGVHNVPRRVVSVVNEFEVIVVDVRMDDGVDAEFYEERYTPELCTCVFVALLELRVPHDDGQCRRLQDILDRRQTRHVLAWGRLCHKSMVGIIVFDAMNRFGYNWHPRCCIAIRGNG
ncbi:hypothetical protein D320_18542 [Haloferax sp. BAB-2207]|nr:hypothetical protein D320_18542 [Haloferax sp. BAB-2207]